MSDNKFDKSYDFRTSIVDLSGVVKDLKNDVIDGNFYTGRLLDKLDYMTIIIHDMLDRITPTDPPPQFYPEQGTVFIDDVTRPKNPCVVESKMLLSTPNEGWVCYYDREEGMSDYPRWLTAVEAGNVKVVWCPSMGIVQSNADYLAFWSVRGR